MEHLERHHADLGPVLAWDGLDCELVLATDAQDVASAADAVTRAVTDSLRASGLGDRYPAAIEIEAIEPESEPVATWRSAVGTIVPDTRRRYPMLPTISS